MTALELSVLIDDVSAMSDYIDALIENSGDGVNTGQDLELPQTKAYTIRNCLDKCATFMCEKLNDIKV